MCGFFTWWLEGENLWLWLLFVVRGRREKRRSGKPEGVCLEGALVPAGREEAQWTGSRQVHTKPISGVEEEKTPHPAGRHHTFRGEEGSRAVEDRGTLPIRAREWHGTPEKD